MMARTMCLLFVVFFFSSRRRHTRLVSDWSSDVCSSDLGRQLIAAALCSNKSLGSCGGRSAVCVVLIRRPDAAPTPFCPPPFRERNPTDKIGRASCRERV